MWEPRRLTTLRASPASYSESCSFIIIIIIIITIVIIIIIIIINGNIEPADSLVNSLNMVST
jgi:hypothetical protein